MFLEEIRREEEEEQEDEQDDEHCPDRRASPHTGKTTGESGLLATGHAAHGLSHLTLTHGWYKKKLLNKCWEKSTGQTVA